MPVTRIDIETFLSFHFQHPVIDVRSEGEFHHAHIPGACSMPLFNNEERKEVGTAYKQESKQKAIKIGLQYFGKKMVNMVEKVEAIVQEEKYKESKTIVVHCWRGGMRSGGVGWLLDLYGFKVYTLIGGYKAFRQWGLQQLEKDYPLQIIGGYTGSGKTYVLQQLQKKHQSIIDLEAIAKHKGSAFGNIGMPPQPSQEMFENILALELWKKTKEVDSWQLTDDSNTKSHSSLNKSQHEDKSEVGDKNYPSTVNHQPSTPIWLEDESQRIGLVNIPTPFFKTMRSKPVYFLNIPFEERLQHIVQGYGQSSKESLANAILRIQKRLGGVETKAALLFLEEGSMEECFRILLKYYDKLYEKGLHSREAWKDLVCKVDSGSVDAEKNAMLIMEAQNLK